MSSIFASAPRPALLLFAFVILREEARRRYVAGAPWPHSSDPVLAGPYSFCNVRREDDRVSRWQAEFVRGRYGGQPEYWPAAFTFRAFNHIGTDGRDGVGEVFFIRPNSDGRTPFEAALATNDVAPLRQALSALSGSHIGHAYSIRGLSRRKEDMSVDDQLLVQIGYFLTRLDWRGVFEIGVRRPELLKLAGVAHFCRRVPGMGAFKVAQSVADWKYALPFDPSLTPDWWHWAAPGPGSEEGMNIVLGYPLEKRWTGRRGEEEWLVELRRLLGLVKRVLAAVGHPPIHCQDLQNALCELAKAFELARGIRLRNKHSHFPALERVPADEDAFERVAMEVCAADRAALERAGFPEEAIPRVDEAHAELHELWLGLRRHFGVTAEPKRVRPQKLGVAAVGAPLIDM
jgi:hypothetical protein